MNQTWLVPAYYRNFSCKIDQCRHTCCSRWRIPVSKDEYLKLVTSECSDDLDRRIRNAFIMPEIADDEVYRYIGFNWLGYCPIMEEGFCKIHKEKGEDYLPEVCKLYPRSLKKINDTYVACCSDSCEKIIELLYEENRFELTETGLDAEAKIFLTSDEQQKDSILQEGR